MDTEEGSCGTRGCAVGECPILWPSDWEFSFKSRQPVVMELAEERHGPKSPVEHAAYWFDIDYHDASKLFLPSATGLKTSATKEEVAAEILKLIGEEANG
jgi:hypothetical protein